MSQPAPGAPVHLATLLVRKHVFGVFSDGDTPAMTTITEEYIDGDSVMCVPIMKGDDGEPGMPSPVVDLQHDYTTVPTPADLPTNLTEADKGKAWWFPGSPNIYVWFGDRYLMRPAGAEGPAGPTPSITAFAERVPPGTGTTVVQSGTDANPVLRFKIDAPAGPPGPSKAISLSEDFYVSGPPPQNGQVLTWNESLNSGNGLWEASDFASMHPMMFTIPEAAFQNKSQIISGRMTILSYQLPPLDYAWVPFILGHFKAFGIDLNILDPFKIGGEVRIGDPISGTLIARGMGTIAQETVLTPHVSSPGDPSAAVSPDNQVAQVNPGEVITINVNLVNDGILGMYSFNRQNAQLAILAIPQGAA